MQRSTPTSCHVPFLLAAPFAAQRWFDAIRLNDGATPGLHVATAS